MQHKFKTQISTGLFICLYIFSGTAYAENSTKSESNNSDQAKIKVLVISKEDMQLTAYDEKGLIAMQFPMACGLNYGNKKVKGDKKTPEGTFKITEINNASTWSHDFKDGKGVIRHAYGDHFVRLGVPGNRSIGIHGTHDPESIGTRASEGCIRLNNNHLDSLVAILDKTETVVILPSIQDVLLDQNVEMNPHTSRTMAIVKRLIQPILLPELYTVLPQKEARLDVLY